MQYHKCSCSTTELSNRLEEMAMGKVIMVTQILHTIGSKTIQCVEYIARLEMAKNELERQARQFKEKIDRLKVYAEKLTDTVKTFYQYADLDDSELEDLKKSTTKMKLTVKKRKFKSIRNYVDLVSNSLEISMDCYEKEFTPIYEDAKTQFKTLIDNLERRRIEVTITKAIGHAAETLVDATKSGTKYLIRRVTAMYKAGEEGSEDGEGAAEGGAEGGTESRAEDGTGTVVTTHLTDIKEELTSLRREMDSLDADISQLGLAMLKINTILENTKSDVNILEKSTSYKQHDLIRVLETFVDKIKGDHDRIRQVL